MKLQTITLWFFAIFIVTLIAQDENQKPLDPIDVTDEKAIEAAVGKNVLIKGKVRSSDSAPQTADIRIQFSDSLFRLYIKSDVFDSKENWGIDESIGKDVFVHGKIVKNGAFTQIVLKDPKQWGTNKADVMAAKPKENKPGEGDNKKYEPVSSGAILPVKPGEKELSPKITEASVKVVLGMHATEVPEMVVSEVRAEIIDAEDSGPMQATFESKPKLNTKPMISVMTYLPRKYSGQGWPFNQNVHFVIDEIQADSAPPNFAAAFLIECILRGIQVPENLVLFGGMDGAGKINFNIDKKRSPGSLGQAIKLAAQAANAQGEDPDEEKPKPQFSTPSALGKKAPVAKDTFYFLTGQVSGAILDDLILENDMSSINSTQVISCLDLDEAVNFARDISEGIGFGKSLNDLSEAQKVLRDRSVRMLSNAQVWSRVVAAGRATPKNKTAFAYARLRTRKTSKTFSLDKCLSHLDQQIISAQGNGLDKFNDREMRKYVRDLADKMKEIQGKIHPKALPVLTSAQIYLKEISDLASEKRDAKAKATEIPERAQKDYDNAKKAYEESKAAALAAP